jgi:acylphosphatase
VSGEREIVHVIVRGRVQGVSFRAWTARHAEGRGIDGWIRNREDGSVEAVLAGPPDAVRQVVDACRVGPPTALVTDVITLPHPDEPALGFRVRA